MTGQKISSSETSETPESLFLRFHYAEVKDLAKHFLTLIAGSLVLSVSFADKILPVAQANPLQKYLLGSSWLGFVASFVLAGLGVFMNYLAGEQANGAVVYDYDVHFKILARKAYTLLDLGAIAFACGLLLLAATAVTRYFA